LGRLHGGLHVLPAEHSRTSLEFLVRQHVDCQSYAARVRAVALAGSGHARQTSFARCMKAKRRFSVKK
jgi:hypothetical protein